MKNLLICLSYLIMGTAISHSMSFSLDDIPFQPNFVLHERTNNPILASAFPKRSEPSKITKYTLMQD